jgi:glycosyltransferase involved in cell wall biosynthesis
MRIGIDARFYGPEHTGLGRYVTNLVNNLLKQDKKNSYVLFVSKEHSTDFKPGPNLKIVTVNVPIYSFSEQIFLPIVYLKEKLDLLHVPHFNAPIFYPKKFIITLHDLIKHTSRGKDTTTRSPAIYWLKRLGYTIEFWFLSRRAKAIIAPTNFVKDDVVKNLKINGEKVFVTYEASDGKIKKQTLTPKDKNKILTKYNLSQPFVVYTGNVYPHKNIDLLIDGILAHNKKKEVDLNLAIACARSVFYKRIEDKIAKLKAQKYIKLLGFVDDSELGKLYSLALCLVHPSKMEGFGLTGIEAMAAGLPVISSNASCLPEVYGNAALYFDPNSVEDLANMLEKIISSEQLRQELIVKGLAQCKKYSWVKMTKETISVYETIGK